MAKWHWLPKRIGWSPENSESWSNLRYACQAEKPIISGPHHLVVRKICAHEHGAVVAPALKATGLATEPKGKTMSWLSYSNARVINYIWVRPELAKPRPVPVRIIFCSFMWVRSTNPSELL
jgi:hypothetical protein